MEAPVAILILLITLVIAALAVYLLLTILELTKINKGLSQVLDGVTEIVTKTAPVNGVLDAINTTLVAGRDLLEGLALKKTGSDAAGLVESCFPGEGQRFQQRVGVHGPIVAIGEDYARGAGDPQLAARRPAGGRRCARSSRAHVGQGPAPMGAVKGRTGA